MSVVQIETVLKLRIWGEREDMPDDERYGRWLTSELYVVSRKLTMGYECGDLVGPGGQRGWWEIETSAGEKENSHGR